MTSQTNIHSRERLAWTFLLAGFILFLAIAISTPLGITAYLRNTTQPLPAVVQANQGTIRIDDVTGSSRATSPGEPVESIESGSKILTDATATGLVYVFPPESEQILARIQIYGNSNVFLDRIDAPRFEYSKAEQRLDLSLQSGRLQLAVPENQGRQFVVRVSAPQGELSIYEPGQYSVEVTNAVAQVAVQNGQAVVSAGEEQLTLLTDQRAVIPNGSGPQGPLDAERNLIKNGDFADFFDEWSLFTWNVERDDQPDGQAKILNIAGEPTLQIIREGDGHADVKLRQVIGQDVTDYESLRMLMTFRIVNQNLDVCGVQGSECPLFLRMNYSDDSGISRTWQHGFYGQGEVSASLSPDACISCDVVQSVHQPVQLGQVYFYEVDFRADLARQGYLPPRVIENVTLVSSGHSFEVEVIDLALMAKE